MHELAIAKGIIDIVSREAQERAFTRVLTVTLSVGEYSGVVPECLEEFFPIAAAGTPAEGAALEFIVPESEFSCYDCGYTGAVERKRACCPRCGGTALKMTRGREFYVESLKVE